MRAIEETVRQETNRLLQRRASIVATVVVLGIVAGYSYDLAAGRFFEDPARQLINVFGLLAMGSIIVLSRGRRHLPDARKLALTTTFFFCMFIAAMSPHAGPDARTVIVVANTVMILGAATLLPWGPGCQLALVVVGILSIRGSFVLLGHPLLWDPYVAIATGAGFTLSVFLAQYLERNRLLLVTNRLELAKQKEIAEQEKRNAEALAQDLDGYAQAVAHDLKNPIQVIDGYTDLLQDKLAEDLDDEARHYLRQTAQGCTKMTQIINELLLLATVRKRGSVPSGPIDMGSVVREVRQRLGPAIEAADAELVEPDNWPTAVGHAPWVEEIWANFVSNAIKYGGKPPRIELGAHSNGNGKVHYWVRDNGPGLDADQQERLFEEFSRLSPRTADGHGLGLAIAKLIAERLGGEVSVESEPGRGSTFGFTLPR